MINGLIQIWIQHKKTRTIQTFKSIETLIGHLLSFSDELSVGSFAFDYWTQKVESARNKANYYGDICGGILKLIVQCRYHSLFCVVPAD